MPVLELGHDHPIWLMKEKETAVIADYLLSQQQLERSIKTQYEAPFFELANSSDKTKRQQWIFGGFLILAELAEHYVNTQSLKRHLHLNHKITC